MATITLKGAPIHTSGDLPPVGAPAPNFTLVRGDLSEVTLDDLTGKKILNVFPSVDTGVCATSVKTFHEKTARLQGTTVLNISADLPFAQARFCGAEGLDNVETLSAFRSTFPREYGLEIVDGVLKGLCSRAVVVIDEQNRIVYTEQVPEIGQEPNYGAALEAITEKV